MCVQLWFHAWLFSSLSSSTLVSLKDDRGTELVLSAVFGGVILWFPGESKLAASLLVSPFLFFPLSLSFETYMLKAQPHRKPSLTKPQQQNYHPYPLPKTLWQLACVTVSQPAEPGCCAVGRNAQAGQETPRRSTVSASKGRRSWGSYRFLSGLCGGAFCCSEGRGNIASVCITANVKTAGALCGAARVLKRSRVKAKLGFDLSGWKFRH